MKGLETEAPVEGRGCEHLLEEAPVGVLCLSEESRILRLPLPGGLVYDRCRLGGYLAAVWVDPGREILLESHRRPLASHGPPSGGGGGWLVLGLPFTEPDGARAKAERLRRLIADHRFPLGEGGGRWGWR